MYKKILIPLDGPQLAEAALPHAEALAKSENAEIIILRVPVTPQSELMVKDPGYVSIIIKEIENEAQSYVKKEVEKLKEEGFKVSGMTREGSVPDVILAAAEETHADMIAMSTHGRTGMQRWLMGSVADRVVRRFRVESRSHAS